MDLSQLYGVTEEETQKLRRFRGGKLHTKHDKAALSNLPIVNDVTKFCTVNSTDADCYQSGDPRVNSNPYSAALHTVFLRSHNKIASTLSRRYHHWNDEDLFYMSRVLNTIIYQRIIYEEWAPVVLGQEVASKILETNDGIRINRVSNEFATVGIRFYNSMFPGDLLSVESKPITSNVINEPVST